MNDQMDDSVTGNERQTTAVSLFDEAGASGDFPVLKAFQQYIDAEQAKARKRMVWLSAFFITLLVVVVVVFSFIMAAVISRDQQNLSAIASRNQELSDKLLDIALKKQDGSQAQAPIVLPTAQQPAADTMRPVLEKLETLATAMSTRPQPEKSAGLDMMKPVLEKLENLASAMSRPQPQAVAVPQVAPAVQQPFPQQTAVDMEAARLREELKQLQEAMKADQVRAQKAEKERLRKEEVERHRRRLYPEYYAREDARKAAEAEAAKRRAANPPSTTAKPAAAPLPPPAEKPATPPAPVPAKPVQPTQATVESPVAAPAKPALPPSVPATEAMKNAKPVDIKNDKPVSYFSEEEDEDLKDLVKQTAAAADGAPAAAKPAPLPEPAAEKPAETKPVQQAPAKAETLNVGAKSGEGVPFVIELPETK